MRWNTLRSSLQSIINSHKPDLWGGKDLTGEVNPEEVPCSEHCYKKNFQVTLNVTMRLQKYNSQQNEALAAKVRLTGQQQQSPEGGLPWDTSSCSCTEVVIHQFKPDNTRCHHHVMSGNSSVLPRNNQLLLLINQLLFSESNKINICGELKIKVVGHFT